jgi:hypothetical protein
MSNLYALKVLTNLDGGNGGGGDGVEPPKEK